MSLSNQDILEGIRAKDYKVINEVYHQYLPIITKMVIRNSGSKEEAKDVFQEGLVVLFEKLKKDDTTREITFGAYIRVVCKNLWLQQLRRGKKVTTSIEVDASAEDVSANVLEDMECAARYKVYREHFKNLGDDCRKVLTLFLNKTSLREIAEKMNFSEQYAKKRKYKCQKKLIESIQNDLRFHELKY